MGKSFKRKSAHSNYIFMKSRHNDFIVRTNEGERTKWKWEIKKKSQKKKLKKIWFAVKKTNKVKRIISFGTTKEKYKKISIFK